MYFCCLILLFETSASLKLRSWGWPAVDPTHCESHDPVWGWGERVGQFLLYIELTGCRATSKLSAFRLQAWSLMQAYRSLLQAYRELPLSSVLSLGVDGKDGGDCKVSSSPAFQCFPVSPSLVASNNDQRKKGHSGNVFPPSAVCCNPGQLGRGGVTPRALSAGAGRAKHWAVMSLGQWVTGSGSSLRLAGWKGSSPGSGEGHRRFQTWDWVSSVT